MKITKYNYIVTVYLFLHYLFGSGETVYVTVAQREKPLVKWTAMYLALGHFDYDKGFDYYDFNEGEWPCWLIRIGNPFYVIWNKDKWRNV